MSKPIDIEHNRADDILWYVFMHPNCTKADVIRYMKGKSAVRTTHYLLTSLINEGKINMQKKHIQTHLLTLNEKNEFIKLYKLISDVESLIISLQTFGSDLEYCRSKIKDDNKFRNLLMGLNGFENSFIELLGLILPILVRRIRGLAYTQRDYNILFHAFNTACYRLAPVIWDGETSKQILENSTKNIERCFISYYRYINTKHRLEEISKSIINSLQKEIKKN